MPLPNFIVGGALKSGTTSLNYYLKQHPQVFMSPFKEPRYFAFDPDNPVHVAGTGLHFPIRTLSEYEALFANAGDARAVGEVSPHYIISHLAPARIAGTIPDARLIFSLRQPVDRAYSLYWHNVRLGNEDRPVEAALTTDSVAVTSGRYYEQLARWYDCFDPAQLHIILFDDLKVDSMAEFVRLCRFLHIDDSFEPDMTVRNVGGTVKNRRLGRLFEALKANSIKQAVAPMLPESVRSTLAGVRSRNFEAPPPMPAELADRLAAYYLSDIERLETLLGRDLSRWKSRQLQPVGGPE